MGVTLDLKRPLDHSLVVPANLETFRLLHRTFTQFLSLLELQNILKSQVTSEQYEHPCELRGLALRLLPHQELVALSEAHLSSPSLRPFPPALTIFMQW